jgi:hypothetical protein
MSTTPELDRHIEQIVNSNMPRFKRRCKQLIESFNGYNNKKYIDVQCGEEYTSNLKNFFVKIIDDILNDRVSSEIDSILDKMSEKNKSITQDPNIDKIASVMAELFIKDYMSFLSYFRKNRSLTHYKSNAYIETLKTRMKKNFINVLHEIHKNEKKNIKSHYKTHRSQYKTHRRHLSPIIEEDEISINESSPIKGSGKKKKRKTRKNKKKELL